MMIMTIVSQLSTRPSNVLSDQYELFEDFEPEPAALGSMGPWRPPSLPPSPREAHRCWNCQNFFLPDSMYCRSVPGFQTGHDAKCD